MIQGTASDVGKSVITTALCRIFTQDGYRTAPFKSQNMSNNSYVTSDGKEIGRAQAVQAEACRIQVTTDMNPILLKPTGERRSQVVVHGKPLRDYDAVEYRERYLPTAGKIVREALGRLRAAHDIIVMEGAGSPAEVNLRDRDIVNMRAAAWADAPVIIVADIDRGGVFASIVGTMMILRPEERDRVKGFIINKFRGDPSLLASGLEWLEQETGKPVLGVVPMLADLGLEEEDSASLSSTRQAMEPARELNLAVIRLPRAANFTDFAALPKEPDVSLRYVTRPEELGQPDALLLPGTMNVLHDWAALQEGGWDQAVKRYASAGGHVAGIGGGYHMLGEWIRRSDDANGCDDDGPEERRVHGLGLLPLETVYAKEMRAEQVHGAFLGWDSGTEPEWIEGYQIRRGFSSFRDQAGLHPLFLLDGGIPEGAVNESGNVWGTDVHGVFDNDAFRRGWLNHLRSRKGLPPLPVEYKHREARETAFDRLAEHVRRHVDINKIYDIVMIKEADG